MPGFDNYQPPPPAPHPPGFCRRSPFRATLPRATVVGREYDGEDAVHEHQTMQEPPTSVTNETPPDTTIDKPTQPIDATSVDATRPSPAGGSRSSTHATTRGEADVRTRDYVAHAPVSLEPTPLDSEAWTRFLAGFVEAFP